MEIMMNKKVPLMLGVRETAEHFHISQHYARQLALSGAVSAVRVGRNKILINADSVAEYFENTRIPDQTNKTAPPTGISPIPVKI